jgi:hypothetical protein
MHPQGAPQWAYVEQEDFIYDTEIDSRAADEEYEEIDDDTTEEVVLDSREADNF